MRKGSSFESTGEREFEEGSIKEWEGHDHFERNMTQLYHVSAEKTVNKEVRKASTLSYAVMLHDRFKPDCVRLLRQPADYPSG
ncbi:hypothetical protein HHL17_08270 [Chitinophaga sp. G-6-1-13]|uniref:Uncharacterized protein n=1 Tax=Chitinophaga fulva TaxID=2728842 RepID=A0A848GK13_9BACT|nr:hypothetical protein [Chitinophaga fulva]NML37193.1 hypothetical protein [Chitinophaga fulva]